MAMHVGLDGRAQLLDTAFRSTVIRGTTYTTFQVYDAPLFQIIFFTNNF